jgi:hypothetical protein
MDGMKSREESQALRRVRAVLRDQFPYLDKRLLRKMAADSVKQAMKNLRPAPVN